MPAKCLGCFVVVEVSEWSRVQKSRLLADPTRGGAVSADGNCKEVLLLHSVG